MYQKPANSRYREIESLTDNIGQLSFDATVDSPKFQYQPSTPSKFRGENQSPSPTRSVNGADVSRTSMMDVDDSNADIDYTRSPKSCLSTFTRKLPQTTLRGLSTCAKCIFLTITVICSTTLSVEESVLGRL